MFLPALSYPQYRLLWLSGLSTWIGRWIETVVGAWLVLELTNSPFLVGLLGTFRFSSMVLGPFCGALCDRISQRSILMAVQIVYATASLTLLALFASSQIRVWHIFAFTFIGGLCYTFDFSTRYSIAASIVHRNHIVSSISIMQVANGATSVIGPLIGGSLLAVIGATGCFLMITTSFIFSLCALVPLKMVQNVRTDNGSSIFGDLLSGLRYIKGDRFLLSLVLLAALINLLIYPYIYTLMPIFSRSTLGIQAGGFGLLMALGGLGTVLGSLTTESWSRFTSQGKLLTGAIMLWPVIFVFLSFTQTFLPAAALFFMAGITQGITMALIQALMLIRSTEEMRGRVSGARTFAISTLSLGNLMHGYEAAVLGVPTAFIANSTVFIVITAFIFFWTPELFRYKETRHPQ